jgi:hypothetical protein
MSLCVICQRPLEGPGLVVDDSGSGVHPRCLAERLPSDAALAVLAAAGVFLIPLILVWSA